MFRPERLVQLRKKKGFTQEELGLKVNSTKGTISNYENGHSSPPGETLVLIANALNTTTDYLLGRTDDPEEFRTNMSFYGGSKKYTPDEIAVMEATLKAYREQLQKIKDDEKK